MPRPTGLTRPQIGSGRASPGTVDVSAWSNPDQGTDGLRTHVQDPSRAHMASTIGIVDAGGYYSSDEVEGALQELGGASDSGRQNGVVTGFGYVAVGLTVTFNTPSTALLPTLRTYSGESITLPDNTPSVWVYLAPSTGLITQFVGANPPTISGPENVLLWRFSTLAGAITVARDARLYVRNLDRKLPFTVRASNPQVDRESEACFVSFDAVLTYLQFATTLNGLRTEVIVRGPVNTGPIVLPATADGLHIRGEDGGALVLTSGAYLLDTQGRDGVTLSDLQLQTNVAGATAILDSVGTSASLSITRCNLIDGTSSWQQGIDLPNVSGQLTVSNTRIEVTTTGILVASPNGVVIDQATVNAINFVPGSVGVRVGVSPADPTENPSTIRACVVTGFDSGIVVSGVGHTVTGCSIVPGLGGAVGVRIDSSQDVVVAGNRIDCSINGGLTGIFVVGVAAAKVTGLKLIDNTVYGSANYGIELRGFVQESFVQGNQVDCNLPGAPTDPTALAGVYLRAFGGATDVPAYNVISGNTVWRARTGIYLAGSATQALIDTVISGNTVHHCAVGTAVPPVAFGDTSIGIGAVWCVGLNVAGNNLTGIGRILTDAGAVLNPTPALVSSIGVFLEDCDTATVSGNQVRGLFRKGASEAKGIWIKGSGTGPGLTINGTRVTDNGVALIPNTGILLYAGAAGAVSTRVFDGAIISGNTLSGVGAGIEAVADGRGTISDLRIEGNDVNATTIGPGISVVATSAVLPVTPGIIIGAQVVGNTVSDGSGGASASISVLCADDASITRASVDRNQVRLPANHGIELAAGTALGTGAANFNQVSVSGNMIVMAGIATACGVRWASYVATSATNLDVSNNTITNTDYGLDFVLSGPAATATTVAEMTINRNTITATDRGIYLAIIGLVRRFSAIENSVEAGINVFTLGALQPGGPTNLVCSSIVLSRNRLQSIPDGSNTQISIANMKAYDVRIEDNTFLGGDVASGGGLSFIVSGSSSGTAPSVRGLSVCRNLFRDILGRGSNIVVSGPTDPVHDLSISKNTFIEVATDVALVRASVIQCVLETSVRNLAVRDNQFTSVGHSTTSHGGIDLILGSCQGVDLSGNQFDAATNPSYGNIVSLEPTATPGPLRDVSVCRNKARGVVVPAVATTPAYLALDVRTFTEVTNLSVCDNDLDRVDNGPGNTIGVRVWADAPVYRFACDRNRVTGVNVTSLAFSLAMDAGVDDASVLHNSVDGDTTTGAYSSGISLSVGATSSALRVSDNTVRGVPGTSGYGVIVQTPITGASLNGSYIERNVAQGYEYNLSVKFGTCANLVVAENNVSGHTNTGVEVLCTGTGGTAINLSVDGNKVTTFTDSQTYGVRVAATDDNDYENLSVCNNAIRYQQVGGGAVVASNYGLYIETGTAGATRMENAHVCRNQVLSMETGINLGSGVTLNVRVDDNDIRNVEGGISHLFKGDVIGYSASKNSVAALTSSPVAGLIYVRHSTANDSFHEVTIDGNIVGGGVTVLGSTYGGLAGIRVGALLAEANARSVSISNNQVRLSKIGIITIFASGHSVSVDNNKVTRTYNDGISVTSSFGLSAADTLDLSICGNSVTQWCGLAAANHRAIACIIGTSGSNYARGITIANNNCHATTDTSLGFYLSFLAQNSSAIVFANNAVTFPLNAPVPANTAALDVRTGAGTYANFAFTGNVFRGSATGISYTAGAGAPPAQCTFMGNIGDTTPGVNFSWSNFEVGGGFGWTNVLPPPGAGAGQFQDFNIDNGT